MDNLSSQSGQKTIAEMGKPKKRRWLWGLGGGIALICLFACIFLLLFVKNLLEPPLINAEYSIPVTVRQGDEFDLIISMKNTTSEAIFIRHFLLDESVGPSILDGAMVLSTEPEMKIDETFKENFGYSYFRAIPPGETKSVKFHLRAETVGTFGGPISAYAEPRDKLFGTYPYALYLDPVTITITP